MADLSKIKLNGTEYDLKDAFSREEINNIRSNLFTADMLHDADLTANIIYSIIKEESENFSLHILSSLSSDTSQSLNVLSFLLSYLSAADKVFFYQLSQPILFINLHLIDVFMDDNGQNLFEKFIGIKLQGIDNSNNLYTFIFEKDKDGLLVGRLDKDKNIVNSDLATVATSGSYNDLTDKPTIPNVPAWALTENKPTYTASEVGALPSTYTAPVTSVNEETGNVIINKIKTTASSNNVEYNLMGTSNNNNTMAVSPYNQDLLSFAKTTNESRLTIGSTATPGKVRLYSSANSASGYTELKSNVSGTNTREISFPDAAGTVALTTDIPNVPSWALAANKPSYTFSELTAHPTSLGEYGITDAYTKTEVDGLVSGVLHYKGTKTTVSALPSSGNTTGDVWHVTADGSEWAWDGSDWQELGTAVDLSGYVPTSRTINGKALTSNISLTARDVRALPSNTTYVSSFNGSTGAITYTAPVTSVNGQTGAVTVTTTVTQTLTSGTAIGSVAGTTLYAPAAYDDTALAARVTALEQIPWVTYYTGSNAPSNSQGTNGDLYFQTSE